MNRHVYQLSICVAVLTAAAGVRAEVNSVDAVLEAERQRIEAIKRASAATVAVFDAGGQGGGSGVIVSPDGFALTNFHVAAPCGPAMKCGLPDGKLYDTVIVGIDPVGDVALIQLLGRDDFPHAQLGDSDEVAVGDWVFVAGNPFLLANDFRPSVSYGMVSGVRRYQYPAGTLLEYAECIQTDAAINPGNSGGPLFSAEGRLIGVNGRGSFEKRGRVNVGVGYAISINQIKRFLAHLKSGRIVDHATLGAIVSTAQDGRVLVDDILEDCDAYRRGLRYGDEIVQFAGREITSTNALKNALGVFPRGWLVPLSYRRDGETFDTYVRLMGVHDQSQLYDLVQQEAAKPVKPPQGDKPKDGKPRNDDTPRERPQRRPTLSKKLKLPESVAARYESRRGYANYWYNREKQQELWQRYRGMSDLKGVGYRWTIKGHLPDGRDFQLELREQESSLRLPYGNYGVGFRGELDEQLSPPGSGGLLLAVHLWQRLLDKGLAKFGEVTYLGQLPIGPDGDQADCLVGTYAGLEVHFLFSLATGDLVGIDLFPAEHLDPCELRFSDFGEIADRRLPRHWKIVYGETVFAEFEIEKWEFE
jgi:serine protease Do